MGLRPFSTIFMARWSLIHCPALANWINYWPVNCWKCPLGRRLYYQKPILDIGPEPPCELGHWEGVCWNNGRVVAGFRAHYTAGAAITSTIRQLVFFGNWL